MLVCYRSSPTFCGADAACELPSRTRLTDGLSAANETRSEKNCSFTSASAVPVPLQITAVCSRMMSGWYWRAGPLSRNGSSEGSAVRGRTCATRVRRAGRSGATTIPNGTFVVCRTSFMPAARRCGTNQFSALASGRGPRTIRTCRKWMISPAARAKAALILSGMAESTCRWLHSTLIGPCERPCSSHQATSVSVAVAPAIRRVLSS